nr:DUF1028 domain-containing protein [Candidatus Frankia alpina]
MGGTGLDALHAGLSADDVAAMIGRLPGADAAQLGIVAADGGAAVVSGPRVEAEVSAARRKNVCVAANLMEHPEVARRTIAVYDASSAQPFPARLVAALAADEMGGDLRGRQSVTLRVVDPAMSSGETQSGRPVSGEVDLRVDDARDPVGELRRLWELHRSFQHLLHAMNPDGLYEDLAHIEAALAITPDDLTAVGAAALALTRAGRLHDATPFLRRLAAEEPRTALRLRRLAASGRLDSSAAHAALQILEDQSD